MAESLISMSGAGVQRGDKWLVRNIDLNIRPGEIVTLIGPNGSGKSTTARMAIGVEKASEGRIDRRAGLRIGYVPQKLAIDWTLPLTVRRLMTLTSPHSPEEVASSLESLGVDHLADAAVQQLSGGEFQRVLLARAMIRHPHLLVLDEPVQGVDFSGEVAIYDLIKRIRDNTGCGILMISHDLHVVMAATDTVLCLNGHVCCRGTPDSVAQSAEYRELFGERAAGTLAIYSHDHDHDHGHSHDHAHHHRDHGHA